MDIHGYLWISMDFHGSSMDIHGYPWISMNIHGYPWTAMDIYGLPGAGGTVQHPFGEPLGQETLTHSLLQNVRTPSGQPGWGTK